ncbi:copper resistance system multicopper oxidase, partial [Pantoea septica]|uniref:copper resistance system multicopper oxidase n=1 Tax=Pantoea septica TaxID=472695 RepID=UPI0028A7A281
MQLKSSRRNFIKGIAAASVAGGLGMKTFNAFSAVSLVQPRTLTGNDFDLFIAETPLNITGNIRYAKTINSGLPGPLLRWKEGDTVTLRVKNRLKETTSIHWHGIILPANMDGVPGLSFHGIEPDDTYVYSFRVRQNGTYWYHSHSGLQEQEGVYGPIIIDPAEPEPFKYDREHVVMLTDWSDENASAILSKLKKQSDYYNFAKPAAGDFFRDARDKGLGNTLADRKMWAEMKMNPTDLADVSGATYTYLMNGQGPGKNWTGLFRKGEKIRLRFINGSAMTYFDVRIPGVKMTVVAADGQYVTPVSVDEFRIAVAETYDVIVEPVQDACTIFAQSMDRSGYARGTLAVREGMTAPVPSTDPRPWLTMDDMGMGGMDHGSMGDTDHGQMQGMGGGSMQSMDGSAVESAPAGSMAGMDHSTMAGMDHGS